jgi:hypothetical protein
MIPAGCIVAGIAAVALLRAVPRFVPSASKAF